MVLLFPLYRILTNKGIKTDKVMNIEKKSMKIRIKKRWLTGLLGDGLKQQGCEVQCVELAENFQNSYSHNSSWTHRPEAFKESAMTMIELASKKVLVQVKRLVMGSLR